MKKYVLKRLIQSVITILFVIFIVFLLLRFMPKSGYFTREDYINMSESQRNTYLESIGVLDHPLEQLFDFISNLLRGDLGKSITVYPKMDISEILMEKIPYSLVLGISSMIISVFLGLLMGIGMARYKDKFLDNLGTGYVVLVRAVPSLIYIFLIQMWITSLMDWPMLFYDDQPVTWILPVVSLSLTSIAWYAIWLRRFMIDEENRDYVKFARAKGFSQKYIMRNHILRNAIVPLVQYLPSQLLLTIAGSLVIESVYSIPGMGGLLVYAIRQMDNNLIQILVLIFSVLGVIGIFLGDILMMLVDPRIKLAGKEE